MAFTTGVSAMSAIVLLSGQASVQDRSPSLAALSACRSVVDSAARLACYDTAVDALDTAERRGEVVVLDRVEIGAARREMFGFDIPPVSRIFGGDPAAEISSIETTLARATEIGRNRWVFHLADGGVWRQVDTDPFRGQPRPGDVVRIRKASLGSFLMTVGSSRAIRVRRQ